MIDDKRTIGRALTRTLERWQDPWILGYFRQAHLRKRTYLLDFAHIKERIIPSQVRPWLDLTPLLKQSIPPDEVVA